MAEQADHLMVIRKRRKEVRIGRSKTKGRERQAEGEELRTDSPFLQFAPPKPLTQL